MLATSCSFFTPEPEPATYTVVRGDTLFVIARDHQVSVEELRAWNHLEGDLIEVGQVLVLHEHDPSLPLPEVAKSGRKRSAKGSTAKRGPKPKACVPPPSLDELGEEAMIASVGLDQGQLQAGLAPVLSDTLACVGGKRGTLQLELTVGCNGLITRSHVLDAGPFTADESACVINALEQASFDAHQLPDGMSFEYPLSFSD